MLAFIAKYLQYEDLWWAQPQNLRYIPEISSITLPLLYVYMISTYVGNYMTSGQWLSVPSAVLICRTGLLGKGCIALGIWNSICPQIVLGP